MKSAVVAGHICLDVIPIIERPFELLPGRLYEVGGPTMATGGAVSNTGLALHILGIPTLLMGKVGADSFGKSILDIVAQKAPGLEKNFIVDAEVETSYSVVINIPGTDRIFLHNPGANASFAARDIDYETLSQADLFHFGYPSFMAQSYANEGAELIDMYQRAKACGLSTSLDPGMPDPGGEAGKVPWKKVLQKLLPYVDVFLPSADELLFMLDRDNFGKGDNLSVAELEALSSQLLDMGVALAGIKLGAKGLYIRSSDEERIAEMGRGKPENPKLWARQQFWFPIFKEKEFKGATGAGDTTIAGFLAAMLKGQSLRQAGLFACAVGACNVEAPDALSGIQSWQATNERLEAGWEKLPVNIEDKGWSLQDGVWEKEE
ncbi:MAG: carbohydrate kinase family protein [Lentisphaeria bacterium]|nr:carbohydrate kinase family protein [Lentisphaeria bacterium]NLZ60816.1 carbohydrate kinase family protein [Lentisphaerota bacterium]